MKNDVELLPVGPYFATCVGTRITEPNRRPALAWVWELEDGKRINQWFAVGSPVSRLLYEGTMFEAGLDPMECPPEAMVGRDAVLWIEVVEGVVKGTKERRLTNVVHQASPL